MSGCGCNSKTPNAGTGTYGNTGIVDSANGPGNGSGSFGSQTFCSKCFRFWAVLFLIFLFLAANRKGK